MVSGMRVGAMWNLVGPMRCSGMGLRSVIDLRKGPTLSPLAGVRLRAIRWMPEAPFPEDRAGVCYFGGFDAAETEAHDPSGILRGNWQSGPAADRPPAGINGNNKAFRLRSR